MANPQENIFSGYGVYEGLGDMACPPGNMEAWPGANFCIPTIGTPTSGCAPGTMEPFPGANICVAAPASGGGAPVVPGPCPAGTIGIPPNCFPIPGIPGAAPAPTPGPAPVPIPVPIPGPTPGPSTGPATASTTPPSDKSWVVPVAVGVGLVALLFVAGSKKKATANRRRRHARSRRR